MVLQALTKVAKRERYRIVIPVPRDIVKDSAFPFAPNEEVVLRIDVRGGRLIVEKAPPGAASEVPRKRRGERG
ncbi:MAG: hypothetical protein HYT80_08395 [Euryarchaeota archaeon]|nr:hypothetical protein [Euryarchaeota archaeon]